MMNKCPEILEFKSTKLCHLKIKLSGLHNSHIATSEVYFFWWDDKIYWTLMYN